MPKSVRRRVNASPSLPSWVHFWAHADRVGTLTWPEKQHYVWRGPVDEQGRPVFSGTDGRARDAMRLVWLYFDEPLKSVEESRPTCRRKLCIRPDHHRRVSKARG